MELSFVEIPIIIFPRDEAATAMAAALGKEEIRRRMGWQNKQLNLWFWVVSVTLTTTTPSHSDFYFRFQNLAVRRHRA